MAISFQPPSDKSFRQIQAAWSSHQKLEAVALRFYQCHAASEWQPQVGDLYCLSRMGRQLMRIMFVSDEEIKAEVMVNDAGQFQDMDRPPFLSFARHDFCSGGFEQHRLPIPSWAWAGVIWAGELAEDGSVDKQLYLNALNSGKELRTKDQ